MNSPGQDLLDTGIIREGMTPEMRLKLRQITLLKEVDSTNSAVLRLPGDRQHAHAVLAESQTGGRGRRQRSWHSPAGGNVYLSLGWWFRESKWPLSTLPLMVAVAVCRALGRAGLHGQGIKWPNDILVDGEKLAGILVELQSAGDGPALAVIGVGLNVRMPSLGQAGPGAAIDLPWTDLASQLGVKDTGISRNRVVSLLLDEMLDALERFERVGFEGFHGAWRDLDLLQGKRIQLENNGQQLVGVARGVDKNGGLLLETVQSGVRVVHSAEASILRG